MKFRGKRIDDNEWIEGFYVYSKGMNRHYIITQGSVTNYARVEFINVHPESVGMSTLQKDKNGVEIFGSIPVGGKMSKGGDRVLTDEAGWKANVLFRGGQFMCKDKGGGFSYQCNWELFEVIGKQYREANNG